MKCLLLLILLINTALANEFVIDHLSIKCSGYNCKKYANKLKTIKGIPTHKRALKRNIKFLLKHY